MAGLLKITLVKSMAGKPEKHRKVLRGMGLTRVGKTVTRENTPATRGMIQAVAHMLRVEER